MEISDSESFLLNLLKNPNILEPVYFHILQNNPKTVEEIGKQLLLSEKVLNEEIVPTLKILNLIEKKYDYFQTTRPSILPENILDSRHNFLSLAILHKLTKKAKNGNDWEKQAVYFLIYKYLVENNLKLFKPNDSILIDKINHWFKEKEYLPLSARGKRILLNPQKFDNWTKLGQYCGIITKINDGYNLVTINPELFYLIMKIYEEKYCSTDQPCSIKKFLKWLNQNFLPVSDVILTDNSDVIAPPYSDIFASLVDFKSVELLIHGDFPRYKITEPRLGGRVPNIFSAYRCLK